MININLTPQALGNQTQGQAGLNTPQVSGAQAQTPGVGATPPVQPQGFPGQPQQPPQFGQPHAFQPQVDALTQAILNTVGRRR